MTDIIAEWSANPCPLHSPLGPAMLRPTPSSWIVMCSLFVGFETLSDANLAEQGKHQNMRLDYAAAIRRLHDLGVMVNASFVFGMDGDDGTALHRRLQAQGRITSTDWDLYDTRHAVYRPGRLRHVAYSGGWKKLDPFWELVIRAKRVVGLNPLLEAVLDRGVPRWRLESAPVDAKLFGDPRGWLRR